jgi:hypothetical protein
MNGDDVAALKEKIAAQIEATEASTRCLAEIHAVLERIEKQLESHTLNLIKALLLILGFQTVALVALVGVKLPMLTVP